MTNAQRFLDLYNELDELFSKVLKQVDYVSFRNRVRDLSTKNAVVKRYRDDLFQLGNLRNAIVHQSKGGTCITGSFGAAEIYLKKSKEKKSQLDCLIITQNGKPTEKIMGIVCVEDIAHFI